MEFEQRGNFLVPKGVDLEDLGGKAERLIRYQELARTHGFHFPNAVALPWQTFLGTATRQGIDYDTGLQWDVEPSIEPSHFSAGEIAVVRQIFDHVERPFFSSSAPGEDSLNARMPGAYSSETGFALTMVESDRGRGMGNLDISAGEEHLDHNLRKLGLVLESYFYAFPTGLRRKHGIPDTGMGVLTREVVGGEQGPRYSLVIQTNFEDGVKVAVVEGYGDRIVSQGLGDTYTYNPTEKRFEGETKIYPFDLEGVVEQVLAFESDLDLPDDFGGDYELALDRELRVHLLQCPPIRKIYNNVDVPDNHNQLVGVKTPRSVVDTPFKRVIYSNALIGPDSKELEQLFDLNKATNDYLLVVLQIPQLWIPEVAYNASGIVEFYRKGGQTPRGNPSIDHYTTFLRTEQIGFANAQLTDGLLQRLGKDEGPRVVELAGRLKVNEFRNQAGLYLDS